MDLIIVAKIGAAHGIKGDVKLQIFLEDPDLFKTLAPFTLKDGSKIKFSSIKPQKQGFVAHIKGISDRNAAEALRNAEIFADKALLPPPDEDEFYYSEMEGLSVKDVEGQEIGTVTKLMDFGAGDLIEIKMSDTGKREIFPFSMQVVPKIAINEGYLVLDAPKIIEAEPNQKDNNNNESV